MPFFSSREKYKKEALLAAVIFLVSSLSFALGYLANREFNHAPIVIEACSVAAQRALQ